MGEEFTGLVACDSSFMPERVKARQVFHTVEKGIVFPQTSCCASVTRPDNLRRLKCKTQFILGRNQFTEEEASPGLILQ